MWNVPPGVALHHVGMRWSGVLHRVDPDGPDYTSGSPDGMRYPPVAILVPEIQSGGHPLLPGAGHALTRPPRVLVRSYPCGTAVTLPYPRHADDTTRKCILHPITAVLGLNVDSQAIPAGVASGGGNDVSSPSMTNFRTESGVLRCKASIPDESSRRGLHTTIGHYTDSNSWLDSAS
jgi:hypothetical protein